MNARRLAASLVLVLLSGATGFLLGREASTGGAPGDRTAIEGQAAEVPVLQARIRRLEADLAARQGPVLTSSPRVGIAREADPAPAPASAPEGSSEGSARAGAATEPPEPVRVAMRRGGMLDVGVYDFGAFSGAHRGAFPADVTFRGVGMDRTLLLLHEGASTGEARNLAFEDLTLDTRGHYLADVRGDEPISLRFERTRVIGWDQKPGGAVLLAARHGAVLARDSRFEGGFGNAPGAGSFFHVRGPFLVRFERCTFLGPFARLYEKSPKASYAWSDCRFEDLPEALRPDVESTEANLQFERCSFTWKASDGPVAGRSRAELNPGWR